MSEEILDRLGKITRMANRMRNKYPDIFSENDKKIIEICQDIMSKTSDIKENEKIVQSK